MMSPDMGESTRGFADADLKNDCDSWRRRMRRAADRLCILDPERFGPQIERIESCLRTDAEWNLESALRSYERWHASRQTGMAS